MLKSQNNKKTVALVGTGISSLSCLYFLLKNNPSQIARIEIFEKEKSISGVLANTQKNGFIFEHGAQGVLSSRTNFTTLVKELNITTASSSSNHVSSQRYFFFKDQIIGISPKNLLKMWRTKLLSFFDLCRILFEFCITKPKNIIVTETVSDFFSRRFGKTFTKHFLTPVMKGIWGGGASKIQMRFAFPTLQLIEQKNRSIIKYFLQSSSKPQTKKEMISFEKGMATLPHTLYTQIQDICRKENIALKLNLECQFNVLSDLSHAYDLILYGGQPWKEKNLLPTHLPSTHTLVVVGIGSSHTHIKKRLDGFGALAVENNPEGVLGVICVHSLNPNHVPKNAFLYRVILGGENMPQHINLKTCPDSQIIQLAKQYLETYELLEEKKSYDFEHVVRHVDYIPLPTQHQDDLLQLIANLETNRPGLFFVGNYLLGPAVDSCIEHACLTAKKISNYISPN